MDFSLVFQGCDSHPDPPSRYVIPAHSEPDFLFSRQKRIHVRKKTIPVDFIFAGSGAFQHPADCTGPPVPGNAKRISGIS